MNLFGNNCCGNDSGSGIWIWILIILILVLCSDGSLFGGGNNCCCDNKPCKGPRENECC
jgi:hypothetical protein